MTITFALDPNLPAPFTIRADIQDMNFTVSGLPRGSGNALLLPVNVGNYPPFIYLTLPSGTQEVVARPSVLLLDPNGNTEGMLCAIFRSTFGGFTFKSIVTGSLSFATGSGTWNLQGDMGPVEGPIVPTASGVGLVLLSVGLLALGALVLLRRSRRTPLGAH